MHPSIKPLLLQTIVALLIALFVYTGTDKILNAETFRQQMMNQPLPLTITKLLTSAIPAAELLTAALLVSSRLRVVGLYMATLLLLSFTVYISLILSGAFPFVPCSCGGILPTLSWKANLIANCGFTAMALIGLRLVIKEVNNPESKIS